MPAEKGYSRAVPIRWLPAFTEKSKPQEHAPCKEWEASVAFLTWIRQQLRQHGRDMQQILMVADGSYDNLNLWKHLPDGVILLARSAKNRVLYALPTAQTGPGRKRKYGERVASPQQRWQSRKGWRKLELEVRGRLRHLQYKVSQPVIRGGAPERRLILIVVRGKQRKNKHGKLTVVNRSRFW